MSRGGDGQSAGHTFGASTRAVMPEHDVVRLLLLRHGEVEGFERRIVRGCIDLAPTDRGRAQHDALAAWTAARSPRPDLVVSSDLVRCRDLAERVARACGAELELAPVLREQSLGAWEGLAWDEVSRREGDRINAYWADYFHTAPTDGESMEALFARVARWWRERRDAWLGRTVALVTHVGPIRALLCDLLGHPGDQALRLAPAIASSTEILWTPAGAVLNAMGERPWAFAPPHAPAARTPVRRIALSGSAGTGKTTLARRLATELELPYVEEGMRRRIESGLELHRLDARGLTELIDELWNEQCAAEDAAIAGSGGFVADRSHLDFAAFRLHYGLVDDLARTHTFMERAVQRAHEGLDLLVSLPHGVLPLETDGVRTTNPFTQLRYQLLVDGLVAQEFPSERTLRVEATDDFERRVDAVLARVNATGTSDAQK